MVIRKDKLKNRAKVTKEVLINPLDTDRETARKTGIGKSTVNRIKQELGQVGTKDDRILGICDTDLEIITSTQAEFLRRLKEEPEKVSPGDIIRAGAESTKRYTIFKGDITDKDGGMKEITIEI